MSSTATKSKERKVAKPKARKSQTIGDLHAQGKLPQNLVLPITVRHIDGVVKKAVQFGWDEAEKYCKGEGRSFICDLLLPNGTRFGDACISDLLPYADMTMEEIVQSLADPDEDEGDFLEDGSAPTTSPEAYFISEEEDENPTGVVR